MINKKQIIEICSPISQADKDSSKFVEIYEFLFRNQDFLAKNIDLCIEEDVFKLAKKYFKAKYKELIPSVPGTVPDTMVDNILNIYYGYEAKKLKEMQLQHQHAMAAENAVGEFIELYLDSVLSQYGWIRCCGQIVSKTDFIKKSGVNYKMLQVKSRDNTENSSSSSVRNGTEIIKWFRYFAKTGKTNWGNFPDTEAKNKLNEEGFVKFVKSYATNN